jgi:hypothetical protein
VELSESITEATERAIRAASHLTDMDAGAVETLRYLARKIETESELREIALRYAEEYDQKPPHVDNVSVPTYLKYCDALGLTPAARLRFVDGKPKEGPGGKLAQLRSVAGGKQT